MQHNQSDKNFDEATYCSVGGQRIGCSQSGWVRTSRYWSGEDHPCQRHRWRIRGHRPSRPLSNFLRWSHFYDAGLVVQPLIEKNKLKKFFQVWIVRKMLLTFSLCEGEAHECGHEDQHSQTFARCWAGCTLSYFVTHTSPIFIYYYRVVWRCRY